MAECMNFRSIVGSNKYRYHGMIWPAITSRHNQKWCVNMEECMNFSLGPSRILTNILWPPVIDTTSRRWLIPGKYYFEVLVKPTLKKELHLSFSRGQNTH